MDDSIKQKNNLMHSMMSNPNMARTFKEALSAPIGSTKRDQAKSILSIMKKVGGMKKDGQGGPMPMQMPQQQQSDPKPIDYSNVVIFPAAPKFRVQTPSPVSTTTSNQSTTNDGQGGPFDNTFNNSDPSFGPSGTSSALSNFSIPDTYTSPFPSPNPIVGGAVGAPSNNSSIFSTSMINNSDPSFGPSNASADFSNFSLPTEAPQKTPASNFVIGGANGAPSDPSRVFSASMLYTPSTSSTLSVPNAKPTNVDDIKKLQDSLVAEGFMTRDQVNTGYGIYGPKTTAAVAKKALQNQPGATKTPVVSPAGASTGPTSVGPTQYGTATSSISSILSNTFRYIVNPAISLGDFIKTNGTADLVNAMIQNEGTNSHDGKEIINNPGHIKFYNLPGQTDSGVKATDGGTFASYSTLDQGKKAIENIITNAASGNSSSYGANPTLGDFVDKYTNTGGSTGGSTGTGDQITTAAQQAVNSQTGPGLFAMNTANAKFGGGLDQYISNLDAKLKSDFNLDPLERQLSSLKAESTAFIPTLTSYIQGKDQYSKAIDSMITTAEGQLLTTNMADPFTAKQYTNYMNYLYTLKGRQEGRYTNYLNSAVADYNADVTKTQTQYETVYKNYTDALTRGSTMAQSEYNTLYTTMGDLYNNLEQAPTKLQNAAILNEQLIAAHAANLQNGLGTGAADSTTNPKFWTDVTNLTKQLTDSNAVGEAQGALDTTTLPANGLMGFFQANSYAGSDPQAAAYAINSVMAKSLQNNPTISEVTKMKKLVSDLAATQGGDQLAAMIAPTLAKSSAQIMGDYVTTNLSTIKDAANALIKPSGWFGSGATGMKDKAGWKNKYPNIDSTILDNLYDYVSKNMTAGTGDGSSPSDFINKVFAGTSSNVANSLMTTW